MTTTREDQSFGAEFLVKIVEWIGINLTPGDVFDEKDLNSWAEMHEWISDGDQWAIDHGYVLKDE